MNLPTEEGKRFYRLYAALLSYVNRRLEVVPEQFSDPQEYTSLPLAELGVMEDKPNYQLVDDYSYWFWNWR